MATTQFFDPYPCGKHYRPYKLEVSTSISAFVEFKKAAESMYNYCKEQLEKANAATVDYTHKIEFAKTASERNKVTTAMHNMLKDRRYYKDRVEELEDFIKLFNDPKMKDLFNQLSNVIGLVRKQEEYHKDRKYIPRVVKDIFGEK